MPTATFHAFKAELSALKSLFSAIEKKTVRDELLQERLRTLFRTWVSTVKPALYPLLKSKRDFLKLDKELELLANLTSKIKPVNEYLKRLNRAIFLANGLILYLPLRDVSEFQTPINRSELFVNGIPDLPLRLVPNALMGWKRKIEEFIKTYPFDKSVFVMIRYRDRNVNVIKKLKDALSKNNLNAIIASEHNLTDDLYNPIACLLCCSRGIAVFDRIETGQRFNPNVAYELGMMHLLGRECIIFKHKTLKSLHTDILMKLYLEYNTANDVISHIKKWI